MRIVGGFILAAVCGTLAAALAARYRRIEELFAPLVLAMKTIPVASFIILALIWMGSKNLAVLIAFLMVFPILYTNVLSGIRATDDGLREMARVFCVTPVRRIRFIDLPQVMPYFRTGCTVGLGLCWKAGVAAEVIGMPVNSIGERLQQAKVYLDTPEPFAVDDGHRMPQRGRGKAVRLSAGRGWKGGSAAACDGYSWFRICIKPSMESGC